jgi:hypothetical protein
VEALKLPITSCATGHAVKQADVIMRQDEIAVAKRIIASKRNDGCCSQAHHCVNAAAAQYDKQHTGATQVKKAGACGIISSKAVISRVPLELSLRTSMDLS